MQHAASADRSLQARSGPGSGLIALLLAVLCWLGLARPTLEGVRIPEGAPLTRVGVE